MHLRSHDAAFVTCVLVLLMLGCPDVSLDARDYFQFEDPDLIRHADFQWGCLFLGNPMDPISEAIQCFDDTMMQNTFGVSSGTWRQEL